VFRGKQSAGIWPIRKLASISAHQWLIHLRNLGSTRSFDSTIILNSP
jgi:hypothetical protein